MAKIVSLSIILLAIGLFQNNKNESSHIEIKPEQLPYVKHFEIKNGILDLNIDKDKTNVKLETKDTDSIDTKIKVENNNGTSSVYINQK
ncbi:hypothetical protein COX95_00150 [bacterium CG_4_10_14_0_2_um_filter_33_32]|nr:MAG: hypothetical protein COU50_03915 [bacterium CG10_big_fil_rev_8_21_14_0_10_33_18]PIU76644.1 MAG: hypothetical protein COS74_03015 [bacterium CG06_land_8_20_14_3_00_33_50]PIW81509.1 MAG: hypothetical protein COZ97_01375 [bacterium CG_4_8_14_3_um_filter_33_28]PIY85318.1 MAG: hypothetical protein COY76_02810 [bacterium CG_4_10_14_0_8_um_filter_33_57]PIZ86689.1 MAG: hypothetical protein COX95_00150 [bacterium CG_4_10_14_0_2_um_filter_33_32]PJA72160.1 MAG: hypothetical protein CO152_02920 [b